MKFSQFSRCTCLARRWLVVVVVVAAVAAAAVVVAAFAVLQ